MKLKLLISGNAAQLKMYIYRRAPFKYFLQLKLLLLVCLYDERIGQVFVGWLLSLTSSPSSFCSQIRVLFNVLLSNSLCSYPPTNGSSALFLSSYDTKLLLLVLLYPLGTRILFNNKMVIRHIVMWRFLIGLHKLNLIRASAEEVQIKLYTL